MDTTTYCDPKDQETTLEYHDSFLESKLDGSKYPIINEIPRFLLSESDNYTYNWDKQWNRYRNQSDFYTGKPLIKNTLAEVFPLPLEELRNKRVLEVGCGCGRFSEVMLEYGANLDSFDYSGAVDAYKANMIEQSLWDSVKKPNLCQADVYNMPYRKNSYDFVICVHVLQHTPNPEKTIDIMWKMVKPGGYLVIDNYRLKWKSFYPPIGGFGNVFRLFVLRIPLKHQMKVSDAFVRFWFPVHWFFKDSKLIQHILFRISPVRFYYPWLEVDSKEDYFWRAMNDTHDGSTDKYRHRRTVKQIRKKLESLNPQSLSAKAGGNGVIGWAKKST